MSGTIIRLTAVRDETDKGPEHVWISMAHVQEMYGHTAEEPWTDLVMSIPNYIIQVKETPEDIVQKLLSAEIEVIKTTMDH